MKRKLKDSEQTVIKIQKAMIEMMNKMDYEKISVVDIANVVGISRTTFYLFYSSKEDLIHDICDSYLDNFMETFMQSLKLNEEVPISVYKKAFDDLIKYEHILKALINLRLPDFNPYVVMVESIENAVSDFLSGKGYVMKYGGTIELLASLYAANVMTTIKWWLYNYKNADIDLIKNMISDSMYKGYFALIEKQ